MLPRAAPAQGPLRANTTLLFHPSLTFGILTPGCEQEVFDFLNFTRLQHTRESSELQKHLISGRDLTNHTQPRETLAKASLPRPAPPREGPAGAVLTMATRPAPAGRQALVNSAREPAAPPVPLPSPGNPGPTALPPLPRTPDPGPGSPNFTKPWITPDYPLFP